MKIDGPGNIAPVPLSGALRIEVDKIGDSVVLTAPTQPPLISLDEFNAERCREHAEANKPQPNGIACPECGAELADSRPNDSPTLSRFDRLPMRTVKCSACDYYGQRVA